MSYDPGDVWVPQLTVRDENDNLIDATIALDILSPSGLVGTPPVSHGDTGIYSASVLLDEVGPWRATWNVSGTVTGVEEQVAFVRALSTSIVSVVEVRAAAGNLSITDMSDADIQGFIDAATIVVERWVGPVVPRAVTETLYGRSGASRLLLRDYPIISITSVTEGSLGDTPTTVDTTGYELDPYGSIYRLNSRFGDRVTVTYIAGRTVIGEHLRKATVNHVLNAIRRQRSSGTSTFGEAGFITAPDGLDNLVKNDLSVDPYFRAATVA